MVKSAISKKSSSGQKKKPDQRKGHQAGHDTCRNGQGPIPASEQQKIFNIVDKKERNEEIENLVSDYIAHTKFHQKKSIKYNEAWKSAYIGGLFKFHHEEREKNCIAQREYHREYYRQSIAKKPAEEETPVEVNPLKANRRRFTVFFNEDTPGLNNLMMAINDEKATEELAQEVLLSNFKLKK